MDAVRIERDSFGEIEVPAGRLWGAQTQRSLQYFAIGDERMPRALLAALALVKREAARVNAEMGRLDADMAEVGGQQRQSRIEVGAFLVPGQQPEHGESVPRVVQPRASAPAPVRAPSPILIGATSIVSEPMKTSLPISVGCFFSPS